jgi:hypothetical protein
VVKEIGGKQFVYKEKQKGDTTTDDDAPVYRKKDKKKTVKESESERTESEAEEDEDCQKEMTRRASMNEQNAVGMNFQMYEYLKPSPDHRVRQSFKLIEKNQQCCDGVHGS